MRNSENRDILIVIYRIVEKYETVPAFRYQEDAEQFWNDVQKDCAAFFERYPDNALARRLMLAVYEALENQYKQTNPGTLQEKGEQIKI